MISIELSDDERSLLRCGINEWGGPAACTDELAVAMGFAGRDHLFARTPELWEAVKSGAPLPASDWARVLVMTEFVFVSDVFGSGHDWHITTGFSDEGTIRLLRGVQRRLSSAGASRAAFGPTSHQEYQWQSSAATAIRRFRFGSASIEELVAAIDATLQSFGDDLVALRRFREAIEGASDLPDSEQHELVERAAEEAAGEVAGDSDPGQRNFWV